MILSTSTSTFVASRKVVWGPKRIFTTVALLCVGLAPTMAAAKTRTLGTAQEKARAHGQSVNDKMDDRVKEHVANAAAGRSRGKFADVIAVVDGHLPELFRRFSDGGKLDVCNCYVLNRVPVQLLSQLAKYASTHRLAINRPASQRDALSSYAVNANAVDVGNGINSNPYPYTGAGVTVAFIDSGFTSYQHPDLPDKRILAFVDFVNDRTAPYDDNGHGTHVAGIIGGTGELSAKKYAGIAPGASLVSLKVLGQDGQGSIGNILKALDWVYKNGAQYGIRVVNMSVGASVSESYYTDPLGLATRTLVDAGVTVIAAAGNYGKNAAGQLQWGGIGAPGNAPWVLTACAFSTIGTYNVADDIVADFSSSGPTAIDFSAKPDLCAPGRGIVSLAAPGSSLYNTGLLAQPTSWLIPGTVANTYPYSPYESLTGTSMSTAFVSGAVALMLEANPTLTPNLIKAILEYTTISKPGVSALRQGAGFMNVAHAIALASLYAQPVPTSAVPMPPTWSQHILWGNHMLTGGVIDPTANAWRLGVEWGSAKTLGDGGDNIVWGTACGGADCDNIVWGTAGGDNIVWGTAEVGDNIVWGTSTDGDNIVWGTACGGADCDNIVWGTAGGDNIVWGTAEAGDNIVWGTGDGDNIVWGTSNLTNIVWPIFRGGK